jgi:hypothetical protein
MIDINFTGYETFFQRGVWTPKTAFNGLKHNGIARVFTVRGCTHVHQGFHPNIRLKNFDGINDRNIA